MGCADVQRVHCWRLAMLLSPHRRIRELVRCGEDRSLVGSERFAVVAAPMRRHSENDGARLRWRTRMVMFSSFCTNTQRYTNHISFSEIRIIL
jgi:hypothetical protein